MRKFWALFLLFIFLQANTVFSQVFRLPVVIHHFLEHQEDQKEITFFDFLNIHYAQNIEHPDDEHQDHQNLPFKTQTGILFFSKIFVPASIQIEFHTVKKPLIKEHTDLSNFYNSINSQNIWQPPKSI